MMFSKRKRRTNKNRCSFCDFVAKCSYGRAEVQLPLRGVQLFELARKLWKFSFENWIYKIQYEEKKIDFFSSSFWNKNLQQLWKLSFQYCTFRRNNCTLRSKSCTSMKSMLHILLILFAKLNKGSEHFTDNNVVTSLRLCRTSLMRSITSLACNATSLALCLPS